MSGRGRFRPAYAEVDLSAVAANVGLVRAAVGGAAVCAVVKADGYGHGAVPVARAALQAGAERLAVALVEEGVALREAGLDAPVLLLSEAPPGSEAEVVASDLTPTAYTRHGVEALARAAARGGQSGRPLAVELKVDTGMHRVGAPAGEALELAGCIVAEPGLALAGVWTHFAVADEPERAGETAAQVERFDDFCAALAARGIRPARRHAANSAGALMTGAHYDLVRAGIALYGYEPHPSAAPPLPESGRRLLPALSLVSSVSLVKTLDAGEGVSYGLRYRLPERSVIATVPLGYADGVPRRLTGTGAEVLIGGRRRQIVGTVTMDQILIDCGPDAAVQAGDEVVLLGRQGGEAVTADDWARRTGTISYEILCGIGARVPRVYVW